MDSRYEEIGSETWPMLPWWKWPIHRIWLPKGKKTSRHNVQKGRANPCVIQVTVRGQMDGNGVWALRINAVECYHSENLLPDVKNSAVMMVQSRHSFLALSSGENLFCESLWFSLDYKISDLNVLFSKVWFQNHIHQNDLRVIWCADSRAPPEACWILGGWPLRFWTFYKLSRRLLNYSTDLRYNQY